MSDRLLDQPMSTEMYDRIIAVAVKIAGEADVHRLCSTLLSEAQSITGAQGGTLYLASEHEHKEEATLDFVIVRNSVLNIDTDKSNLPPLSLYSDSGEPNLKNVACYAYHRGQRINIEDVYASKGFDFSGTKRFDESTGFNSVSFLTVPLIADTGKVLGVFQLLNATDQGQVVPFDPTQESAIQILANFAAKALETQLASQRRRELLVNLSGTSDTKRLTEQILKEARAITNADGGTIFMLNDKLETPQLEFALMVNDPLDIYLGGSDAGEIDLPPLPLDHHQAKGKSGLATHCATTGEVVNISDAYDNIEFDFSHVREFDQQHDYHSTSFLAVPLTNHEDEVIGVLQLVNARDFRSNEVIPFAEKAEAIVTSLATYAAIALHNRILLQDLKALLDAFIQVIAQAIDAKSSHTSNHCQRVPMLMEMIAQAACEDDKTFADFDLNDDEWYEIRVASWMHDCGKLATPDSVLDKSTKLHLLRDGIYEVQARIAALRQHLRVEYLESLIEHPEDSLEIKATYESKLVTLEEDAAFLLTANKGGEFMSEESKDRVRQVAKQEWPDANGKMQPLLSQKEVDFLCIERGTLSQEERQIINDHMVVTLDMLESLPFPRKLRRVPEYAGGHHEKMDGSGFPRGLTREQMSVPARMMAIADIFEALTSQDRPYKDPMKISLALTILKRMREDNHIDPDLFDLFVRSRVWEKYAKTTLKPEQLDITDAEPYLAQA